MANVADFVLTYKTQTRSFQRDQFKENLKNAGLMLTERSSEDYRHYHIHIKAKNEILRKYAELLNLRMPIHSNYIQKNPKHNSSKYNCCRKFGKILKNILLYPFTNYVNKFPKQQGTMTAPFSRDRMYLFDVDKPNFFNEAQRSMIVKYILELKAKEINDSNIEELILNGDFSAAYPLHNDEYRKRLLKYWGNMCMCFKFQPIDAIKDYFGIKIGLYFAWVGFYTIMLTPVAIFGLLCFIYGVHTAYSNTETIDLCNPNLNITMCPICDADCNYWQLKEGCDASVVTHCFYNYLTIIFAVIMSAWSSIYLNVWERYSAEITHRWGLSDVRHENRTPTPEYIAKLKNLEDKKRKKTSDKAIEKEIIVAPWYVKILARICTHTIILCFISIFVVVVIATVVFQISEMLAKILVNKDDNTNWNGLLLPVTTAVLDLIFILIFNIIYDIIAEKLTKKEFWKTQEEFDDSLTLKIYLFQFLNYYSGFFYIAFIKGNFVGRPGAYDRIFGYRLKECSPDGCLFDLSIQLAIVTIGERLFEMFRTYAWPYVQRKWKEKRASCNKHLIDSGEDIDYNELDRNSRLETSNDYQLVPWSIRGLSDEYLEMITQYGFVTLFVAAFPLAPLFALLFNAIEIRWDAKKFLKNFRRPVAESVSDIGICLKILNVLGKLAIISNGAIIAFTTNFVPYLVYSFSSNENTFLEYNLSVFNTSHFENATISNENVKICYYSDYRNPPEHEYPYKKSEKFWHILAAKIIFLFVYENVVIFFKLLIDFFVPKTSSKLRDLIRKEDQILQRIIAQHQDL